MKQFGMFCIASLAMLGVATLAQAQRAEAKKIALQPRLGADAPLLSADAIEKLKLTAEQKDKYGKIETEYKDKAKSAQEKFRTDIQNLNDRTKYKEVLEKFQADTKKAREDALGKVAPILTAEQKTVFTQVKDQPGRPGIGVRPVPIGGAGIGQVLPAGVQQRLQLTDEQKKQIDAIQKEVEAKIMKVLNDEQKKQLEQMKKGVIIRPQPRQPNPIQIQPIRRPQPANPAPRKD